MSAPAHRAATNGHSVDQATRTPSDVLPNGQGWPSIKSRLVLAALLRIGWQVKHQVGSHRVLVRAGWPQFVFAFHDGEEIGPAMLARIAPRTGLVRDDLR